VWAGISLAAACAREPSRPAPVASVPVVPVAAATAAPTPTPPPPTPKPTPPVIDSIRVGFFAIQCKNGKAVPKNGERKLPVGCVGSVTATPKKADGTDVPAEIHGPKVEWELVHGELFVDLKDFPGGEVFNKQLVGKRAGGFFLCATVKEVGGCMTGEVIP
jgi:hypothetical protein